MSSTTCRSPSATTGRRPYVGTGAEGRVYTVDDAHVVTVVLDTDERQIGAVSMNGANSFVVGGDPAVFHRVLRRGGSDAVWTSKVLDAGLRARFGVVRWSATGPLELSTRTGDAESPDATWSTWSNPARATRRRSRAPPLASCRCARAGAIRTTVLSDVLLPFVTENVRPVVLEVNAAPKVAIAKEPTKETVVASGGEPPKHDATIKLSWKVDDAGQRPAPLPRHLPARRGDDLARRGPPERDAHQDGARVGHLRAPRREVPRSRRGERRGSEPARASDEARARERPLRHRQHAPRLPIAHDGRSGAPRARGGRRRARSCGSRSRSTGSSTWSPLAAADGVFDSAG